jgi:hypothetical protein
MSILSPYLLSEVADVLRRDRIRTRWPLTDEEVYSFCQRLARAGEEVSPPTLPQVIQDPKDQAVVDAAVAGRAKGLGTIRTEPPAGRNADVDLQTIRG